MDLFLQQAPVFVGSPRQSLETLAQLEARARLIEKFINQIRSQPIMLIGEKPWEMTRVIWESIIDPVHQAYKKSIAVGEEAAKAFQTRYGYTHNGYAFHPASVSNSRHEVQVACALLRGDHIPEEVMRDYPKTYWGQSFDLREFQHLPIYITTDEERRKAIACWQDRKDRAISTIDARYFHYSSETELKHKVECCDRLLKELHHE